MGFLGQAGSSEPTRGFFGERAAWVLLWERKTGFQRDLLLVPPSVVLVGLMHQGQEGLMHEVLASQGKHIKPGT